MDFKSENIWLHAIRLVGQVSENMQPELHMKYRSSKKGCFEYQNNLEFC